MKIFSRRFALSLIGFCYFAASTSQSVSAEKPFYDGKTLTVLINYAPGGPTDVEGRLLARHRVAHALFQQAASTTESEKCLIQKIAGEVL